MWINWDALTGGLIIGVAASILLLFNGKIAGVSGIIGGLLRRPLNDSQWRVAFIIGLFMSASAWQLFFILPEINIQANATMLVIAGFLVGFGSRLGSGCTSGHGVCGLSRWSPRSLIATLVFLSTGVLTVYLIRYVFVIT